MGTEYIVHDDPKVTVSLDEMSNRFALCIFGDSVSHYTDADKPMSVTHDQLTPEQVIQMSIKMLQVATYWMDQADFDCQLRLALKERGMMREIKTALED